MRYLVRTTQGIGRRFRAGLCFGPEPETVDGDALQQSQLQALQSDPYLQVTPLGTADAGKEETKAAVPELPLDVVPEAEPEPEAEKAASGKKSGKNKK